jgi:hypothetical protein
MKGGACGMKDSKQSSGGACSLRSGMGNKANMGAKTEGDGENKGMNSLKSNPDDFMEKKGWNRS